MKAGAALKDWLSSPEIISSSLAGVNATAHRIAALPLLADLKHDLEAADPPTTAGVRAAVERFMARDADLVGMIDDLVGAAAKDPFFRPPFPRVNSDLSSGLLLFENPEVMITLGVISVDAVAASKLSQRAATSINFTGVPTLFKFFRGGEATLSMWEAPPIDASFLAEGGGQCRLTGYRQIADGDVLFLDGRSETFTIEHARADIVNLQAVIRVDAAPLSIEYDSRTHEFVGASSTDEAASRIQMMVTLLRLMERDDALPLFEELLQNRHFYTRWHVMREFLAMDAEAALPYLRQMAEADPHADVRAAARQTIETHFSDEEASEEESQCPA